MPRRRALVIGAAVVVVGGIAAAALVAGSGGSDSTAAAPRRSQTLQPVESRTLEETTDVNGTIGYGSATTVRLSGGTASSSGSSAGGATGGASAGGSSASTSSGTITGLPAVGTVIQAGQSLVEIDGTPSGFLMIGERPMWRTLKASVSDGPDVHQLESTLAALGYGKYFTTDDTFSSGTASAIKAWQKANGLDETGSLTPSQVVFVPGGVRVASQVAKLGASASGDVLTVTNTTPLVHVDLDASNVANAHEGDAVKVELPDGSTVDGTILSVGSATSTTSTGQGNQQSTTTTVGIDIAVPAGDLSRFNGATAVVHLVTSKAENAVSVPVKSLLALAEGGYAVERVRDGRHTLVVVKPGAYAGGFVQVSGDLRTGDRVVTP